MTLPAEADRPRVRLCRGCCCGDTDRHPCVDHDGIVEAVRHALPEGTTVVGCLWACDLSSVVVVNPSAAGRARGGRPAWIPHVDTLAAAAAVVEWVRAGGPGLAPAPDALGAPLTAAGLRRLRRPS